MADFVGRHAELEQLETRIASHRFVTVVGPGGIGKTRLVTEFLKSRDGLFIDLASAPDDAAATALIQETIGGGKRWAQTLKKNPILIILDNTEHVIDAAYAAIDAILTSDSSVIATSREPLDHGDEVLLALDPLSAEDTETLLRDIIRRREILPETEIESLDFSRIHHRLDGLPLAVEIVAPRLAIIDRDDRDSFLEGGDLGSHFKRDVSDRHRTLENAFEWSWSGLSEPQRQVLGACSVFPEPFSRDAVSAVCADLDVDQILVDLIDKSLLRRDHTDRGVRFRMLFTIRDAARGKLSAAQEVDALEKMATYFTDITFDTPRYARWKLSEPWLPLRVASQSAIGDGVKLKVFRALRTLWEATWRPGLEERDQVLEFLGDRFPDNADALLLRAESASRNRDYDEYQTYFDALIDHPDLDHEMILQLNIFGSWYIAEYSPEIEERLWEKLRDAIPERKFVFKLTNAMGHTYRGDSEQAGGVLDEAEAQLSSFNSTLAYATMYATRGLHAWRHERIDDAATYFARAADSELSVAHAATYSTILRRLGRDEDALSVARSAFDRAVNANALIPLAISSWNRYLLGDGIEPLEIALAYTEGTGIDSTIWFHLGLAEKAALSTDRAAHAFTRAFESSINPGQAGLAQAMLFLIDRAPRRDIEAQWQDTFWEPEIAFVERVKSALDDSKERADILKLLSDPKTRYERRFLFEYEKMLAQVDLSDVWVFVLDAFRSDRPTLRVSRDGNRAYLPTGETLDLSRRGPMKRILKALVSARLDGVSALGSWDVWDVGWPGETIDPKSATARIYTTINTMRKIGLRDVVETTEDGYTIHPDLAVEFVDD